MAAIVYKKNIQNPDGTILWKQKSLEFKCLVFTSHCNPFSFKALSFFFEKDKNGLIG